jgi:hypothetical protein
MWSADPPVISCLNLISYGWLCVEVPNSSYDSDFMSIDKQFWIGMAVVTVSMLLALWLYLKYA